MFLLQIRGGKLHNIFFHWNPHLKTYSAISLFFFCTRLQNKNKEKKSFIIFLCNVYNNNVPIAFGKNLKHRKSEYIRLPLSNSLYTNGSELLSTDISWGILLMTFGRERWWFNPQFFIYHSPLPMAVVFGENLIWTAAAP